MGKFALPERTEQDEVEFERAAQLLEQGMQLCARQGCNRMFAPYRKFQRYCSQRCRDGSKSKRKLYVRRADMDVTCGRKGCGKVFRTNDSKRRYCSPECYEQHERDRKNEPEERRCLVCQKPFSTTHWLKRYCSGFCRDEARRLRATS